MRVFPEGPMISAPKAVLYRSQQSTSKTGQKTKPLQVIMPSDMGNKNNSNQSCYCSCENKIDTERRIIYWKIENVSASFVKMFKNQVVVQGEKIHIKEHCSEKHRRMIEHTQ